MSQSRIIINIDQGISDYKALSLVSAVVRQGKISETARGKQYCFATTLAGEASVEYVVEARYNGKSTHAFKIHTRKP